MADDEIVEFDDFDSEEEEEVSEDIPDELAEPSKRIAKDALLQQFPAGLLLDLNVFCEKCKTLYTARLDPRDCTESEIALIYAVEWDPTLVIAEDIAEPETEDAIEEKVDVVQVAPTIRMLAAMESPKKSCLSSATHTYMKTNPGVFRAKEASRQAKALVEQVKNLSFLLTPVALRSPPGVVHTVGYLYLSETTLEQVDAKIRKHKMKSV